MSPTPVIESDRKCVGCAYNLRGLPLEGECPECGTPIMSTRRRLDDPLSRMPIEVIKVFRRGGWVASVSLLALVALITAGRLVSWRPEFMKSAMVAVAASWCVAVFLLTPVFDLPHAAFHGFSDQGRLRRWVRWLQPAWVLWAIFELALVAVKGVPPGIVTALTWGSSIMLMVAIAATVCLSVLLRHLAEWARDETADTQLNWVAYFLPTLYLLDLIGLPWWIARLLVSVLMLGIAIAFLYGVISLTRSVHYCVLHAEDQLGQQERRETRQLQEARRTARTISKMDAANRKGPAS